MKNIRKQLSYIEEKTSEIIIKAKDLEKTYTPLLENIHPRYCKSACNLVHYLALRSFDLEKLQNRITETGLLGLSRIESHVMWSLLSVRKISSYLNGKTLQEKTEKAVSAEKSRKMINKNTRVLFGRKPDKRNTRIMVTIPSLAADDYEFVKTLVNTGMNCARINCAHDNPDIWKRIIENIKRAEIDLKKKCTVMMDLAGPKIRSGVIKSPSSGGKKAPKEFIRLKTGESLFINKEGIPGASAVTDSDGKILSPAHVSCTLPEILDYTKQGESIFFDDGTIEGEIEDVCDNGILVRITGAKEDGSKLRSDKGINFPDTDYIPKGFTDKDRSDIRFIAEFADVVNLSFVNCSEDIDCLIAELEKNDSDTGIILKIETKAGFKNLPNLLLTAMKRYPVGVMIARGDLAVETGWKNFAAIQEEIIRVCGSAHIPVIWATQVLENLAKKGIPTRSEITDAATAHRCDCVMLNKGQYIFKAVKMLDRILRRMEIFQNKQNLLLPRLGGSEDLMLASRVFEE